MARTATLPGGLLCFAASLGVAFGGWFRPARVAPAVEELLVTPAVHDFGRVGQAGVLAAEFTVTNHHRQPVRITELARTCSCVQLEADRHDLAPGESTVVRVGWRTSGKQGRVGDTLGIQYQIGSVFAVQQFRVQAEVIPDVTAHPATVTFGKDRPREQTVQLRWRDPAAAGRVTSAHCSAEAVSVTLAEDGRSVRLTFDPAGRVAAGIAHQVMVRLPNSGQSWLELPVTFE